MNLVQMSRSERVRLSMVVSGLPVPRRSSSLLRLRTRFKRLPKSSRLCQRQFWSIWPERQQMSLAEGLYNPPLVSEASQGIGRYFWFEPSHHCADSVTSGGIDVQAPIQRFKRWQLPIPW